MSKSHPKIPPFVGYEPGVAFALWLRDELKDRPPETRRVLAQIADVTEDTVVNWTKSGAALSPGFAKAMVILYALDGWPRFWTRLTGEDETLASLIDHATALIDAIDRKLAEHPSSSEIDDALDRLIKHNRATADRMSALRTKQTLRAVE